MTRKNQKPLGQKPKLDRLTLSDGKEYVLKPMTVNKYIEVEHKFDQPIAKLVLKGRLEVILFMLHLRLRDDYPDLTLEQLGDRIDDDVLARINELMGV